ncbi:MAG: sulfide:quinone oxidoreductase [Myxococcota bacterium]|jgi:sulfide:quinone oxidoreductase
MKRLVILGAGTAGTMMAQKLHRALPEDSWHLTVVDRDDVHVYQPGLLFLPFGDVQAESLIRARKKTLPAAVDLRLEAVDRVDTDGRAIHFVGGGKLEYDILVVATGTRTAPEQTDGMTGPGWHTNVFDFYTLEGASALAARLERFEGGKVAVHFVDMPIKCPVAPLEFAFLADAFFAKKGLRDKVELQYVTPLDAAFTKPRASAALGSLLTQKGIEVVGDFALERVDGEKRVMTSYDGREVDFDLLVTVPLHTGSDVITGSGLGDGFGFIPTHKHTLQSLHDERIFVLGDATDLPTSKAGSVAHFQSEVLTENLLRYIRDAELLEAFDGHANCFIETGYDKALLIDFNYDTEPLPGRWPLPGVGPFSLLAESRINHMGKVGFEWAYWNLLLKGKELPISHRMQRAGKWGAN